jgi:signal transduction histidine kinase
MPDIDHDTARRFLGIIREESQRLTRLLDEILDLSFLESGRVTFNVAPVRLAEVVDRALAATEGLLTSSGTPVERAYAGTEIAVDTDFDRVAQVIINLISNAVKYGRGEAPRVTIAAGETAEAAFIDVADRGPGVAPDKREEIFQKFARLGEANLAGSAGLGLAISREIMRNLGGDLVILPDGPGAVFRVLLPRRAARASAAE